MTDETLEEHRRSLRDRFLSQLTPQQRRDLGEGTEGVRLESLGAAAGISDPEILERLFHHKVGQETLTALSLFPLIAVAWADGKVSADERRAVLDAAEKFGISPGHLNYELLSGWLSREPDAELFAAWKRYVRGLSDSIGEDSKKNLETELLRCALEVARATGGFLALDRVSTVEYAVLSELRSAFA